MALDPVDKFAGGDQTYLREEQYASTANLDARSRLHVRYQTAPIGWPEWLVAQIEWPEGSMLDVGCGPGSIWTEGKPPVRGPITLCDLSAGMVDAAVAAVGAAGYDVEGLVADAQAIPLPDRSRLVIVANHMLYHVPDPARAVAEFARILAPGGVVMAATNGADHMDELKAIEARVFSDRRTDRTAEAFGFDTGRAYLDAAFEEVELRHYRHPLVVTDPADVLAYATSYPPGETADAGRRRRLQELIDEQFVAGDGAMHITRSSGVFLCRGPRHR